MTAKEYMYRPINVYKDIIVLRERISSLRLSVLPSAIRYDKDPVQTSPSDPMPEYMAKLDELEGQLADRVLEYNQVSAEVYETIIRMPSPDVRMVAAKRYLGGKSWPEIEEECHVSLRTIYRLNRTALRFVEGTQ